MTIPQGFMTGMRMRNSSSNFTSQFFAAVTTDRWKASLHAAAVVVCRQYVRVLSVSVQLTPQNDYDGGSLQIGMLNMSKVQGSAVVFPSYQVHKVYPVTRGLRKSLVAWIVGTPPAEYWQHAIVTHEAILRRYDAMNNDESGDADAVPDGLVLRSMMGLGPALLRRREFSKAAELAAAEAAMIDRIYGVLDGHNKDLLAEPPPAGTQPSYWADTLSKALIRQAMAVSAVSTIPNGVALACCQRASQLTPQNGLALACRAKWEMKEARQHATALASYNKALQLNPSLNRDWEVRLTLGDIYRELGLHSEAADNYVATMDVPTCPSSVRRAAERKLRQVASARDSKAQSEPAKGDSQSLL